MTSQNRSSENMKMEKLALVTLLLFSLLACSAGQANSNCTFPGILNLEEEHSMDHTWRFLSPDPMYNTPHRTGQWFIHKNSAYVSHGSSANDYDSADGYDLDCIENVGNDKVLVKRVDVDGTDRFTCVQFIKRSVIVIQLKMAEYAATADASLCDEAHLKNNDTTLVHFHSAMWHQILQKVPYMSCSLDGGFMIRQWYDKDGEPGCVNDVTNALRIEDECDKGSGLHIFHESDNCPSPLDDLDDMYKERLMCIASWSDSDYVYSVATDEWNNIFVCLRMPKNRGDDFDMHIFLDGICDSTPDIAHSTSYRKLSLQKVVVPDLCADASPHCSVLSLDKCTGKVPDLCRETCGVCPKDKSWLSGDLPEAIQRKWLMKTSTSKGIEVTITNRAIQYPGLVTWRYFGPSPCNRTKVGHQKKATEYVLFSTSTNGCLPRVANTMINQFSESVIGVEISRSSPSELPLVNDTAVWSNDMASMCPKTMYLEDDKRVGKGFHTSSYGWRNLVREEENARLFQCNLFEKEKFDIRFKSGERCDATIEVTKNLKDSFDMTVDECGNDNQTTIPGGINNKVRYECMASFKDLQGLGGYLITRTKGDGKSLVNETYLCWYLNQQREGFIMPVSDCNDMTSTYISLDEKDPLATVRFAKAVTSSDPTGVATSLSTFSISLLLMLATTILLTLSF